VLAAPVALTPKRGARRESSDDGSSRNASFRFTSLVGQPNEAAPAVARVAHAAEPQVNRRKEVAKGGSGVVHVLGRTIRPIHRQSRCIGKTSPALDFYKAQVPAEQNGGAPVTSWGQARLHIPQFFASVIRSAHVLAPAAEVQSIVPCGHSHDPF
jgi:hypothetical protein